MNTAEAYSDRLLLDIPPIGISWSSFYELSEIPERDKGLSKSLRDHDATS